MGRTQRLRAPWGGPLNGGLTPPAFIGVKEDPMGISGKPTPAGTKGTPIEENLLRPFQQRSPRDPKGAFFQKELFWRNL